MPSYVTPKKNTQFIFYISLVSQADTKIFQVNPTIAAGDFKVATDDGAPANPVTIPAVDADYTKRIKVTLSTDEMNGDNITLIASDAAGAEWCDLTINIQTSVGLLDEIPADTKTAMEVDGGDLSSLMEGLINKRIWTESTGTLEMFNDAGVTQGSIASQVTTDGTYTTAKRALI